jgi:hypothetical protein
MKQKLRVQFHNKALSLALDAVRGAKQMDRQQVAEESGVSAPTLCRVMKGTLYGFLVSLGGQRLIPDST